MTTLLDHQTTLAYLFYLGFENDTRSALKLTCDIKNKRKGGVLKSVFLCYVFGSKGSGKVQRMWGLICPLAIYSFHLYN